MPMRKMAFMTSELALADPVPLTLANLMTKSLMRNCSAGELGMGATLLIHGVRNADLRFLHVPGRRRAALGAQSAVHANILVLDHHPLRTGQRRRHVQRLTRIGRRRR